MSCEVVAADHMVVRVVNLKASSPTTLELVAGDLGVCLGQGIRLISNEIES